MSERLTAEVTSAIRETLGGLMRLAALGCDDAIERVHRDVTEMRAMAEAEYGRPAREGGRGRRIQPSMDAIQVLACIRDFMAVFDTMPSFRDLGAMLDRSTSVISTRCQELADAGLLERTEHPTGTEGGRWLERAVITPAGYSALAKQPAPAAPERAVIRTGAPEHTLAKEESWPW